MRIPELRPIPASAYLQPTRTVARELLGCLLVRHLEGETLIARIVETEAYLAQDDPGCHATRGRTERNSVMFGPPGSLYVYLIYGMHLCMNLVTQPEGVPEAAFGLTLADNGGDVTRGGFFVAPAPEPPESIAITTRIGLGEGCGEKMPLRYMIADSPWLSRPPRPDAPVIIEER